MSRWIVEPADKPDPHPERLSHEDVQHLVHTHNIYYCSDTRTWGMLARHARYITDFPPGYLEARADDPVIRKLITRIAIQKLRAC